MGKYDKQIERSKQMLAEAQKKYDEAVIKLADASPGVRETVLGTYGRQIEEAKSMIATFEGAND
ncbi:hypothetical protein [Amycolatopsis rifamycinica]|uniref:Uncharacterized protein n=1 Tax=Amycolatopsis rifamycinica TaxID=287986 RepID=A0A066U439_9PSEU|nr:hypothetical protein [Amycolatopsis rifamycinica]KDN21865.1 hypothetical protein DV20_13140 [Amycolatopsis rifamycinica]